MKHFLKNVGVNVGINLNKNERQIIELILNDPTLTSEKLSIKIIKQKLPLGSPTKNLLLER